MDKTNLRKYDIRGAYPAEIDKADAQAFGAAYARSRGAKVVVTAYDMRQSSAAIHDYLCAGLIAGGAHVIDLGPTTIDVLTFATATREYNGALPDGGIMVTAGRNAESETGFKIIGREGQAVSPQELAELVEVTQDIDLHQLHVGGNIPEEVGSDVTHAYLDHLTGALKPYGGWPVEPDTPVFRVLVDPANSAQKSLFMMIAQRVLGVGFEHIVFHYTEPHRDIRCDPDPFNDYRMGRVQATMLSHDADLGLSFDADGGGFALYGKGGVSIQPAYAGAYLAAMIKGRYQDAKIVVDHRAVYPVLYTAQTEGIAAGLSISGSAPMRYSMKAQACQFGAGADGRYFFGDMWWTESGMMGAWLILHLAFLLPQPIHEVVDGLKKGIRVMDELTFTVPEPEKAIARFKAGVEDRMTVTSNGAHEIVARSKEKELDFRLCLRIHEGDGTLRLNLEGNGCGETAMNKLTATFIRTLAKETVPG